MPQRFYAGQNSNDFSEWTDTTGGGGITFVTSVGSALGSTAYGILADDSGTVLQLTYNIPTMSGTVVRYGFRLNKNTFSLTNSIHDLCSITDGVNDVSEISLRDDGAGLFLRTFAFDDALSTNFFDSTPVYPSGDSTVEVRIAQASGPSANDGTIETFVNGVSVGSLTGLDIYNNWPESNTSQFKYRANGGIISGNYYIDEFYVRDDDTEIFPAPTAALARFYQGSGSLSEKFTLPFTSVAPGAMTLDKALGTVVIGSRIPAGVVMIYADNPYPTGTLTDAGLPTGTSFSSVKWI